MFKKPRTSFCRSIRYHTGFQRLFSLLKIANKTIYKNVSYHPTDLRRSCIEPCTGQCLNLAQMCFERVSYIEAWGVNHDNFRNKMWYQKKQTKLLFQYLNISISQIRCYFQFHMTINGSLSKCKLFIDSHGRSIN